MTPESVNDPIRGTYYNKRLKYKMMRGESHV